MPDGKTHKLVGAETGALYVAYGAKEEDGSNWCVEVAGGIFGGFLGGMCPDLLEPAISSWHRGAAHSCAAGSGIVAIASALDAFAQACRVNAEKCKAIEMIQEREVFVPVVPDPLSQLLIGICEFMWRFLAGFVKGFAAGYVSHLALDATFGKRSIPLLMKGF